MSSIEIKVIPTERMFFNSENYFSIYRCDISEESKEVLIKKGWNVSNYGNISFKGYSADLSIGAEYFATITQDDASNYKGSYLLESIRQERPITISEQKVFLSSILTEHQVNNIYEVYKDGEDIIELIENDTFNYEKVKGIGKATYDKMKMKIVENLGIGEALIFLSKYGIKYNMILKLVKEYGDSQIVIQKIQENPYLLTEVKGIGFIKADEIALSVGFDMKSPHRIESCIKHVIGEENKDGHSWIEKRQLLNKCVGYLDIKKEYILEVIKNGFDGLMNVNGKYTTDLIYETEDAIARSIIRLKQGTNKVFESVEIDDFIDDYSERNNVTLEVEQRQFFHDWNENNFMLLVGSGGVGKSWLQKILIELIGKKKLTHCLLSPTGRASKVMSDYSGVPASTIHRRIVIYDNDEEALSTIDEDVIIVDEFSMCDIFITASLMNAITNKNARILFVGDASQLLSVSVGNVLHDLINSEVVHITRLSKIFRQEEGGAKKVISDVRNGIKFLNNTSKGKIKFGKNCLFHMVEKKYMKDGYLHYYGNVISKYNVEDVIVLTPTNKGSLGTIEINKEIQKIANPKSVHKKEKSFGKDDEITYRVGDMVMNIVNNYNVVTNTGETTDIYNGDSGIIIDIREDERVLAIKFGKLVVDMHFDTVFDNLVHSWAITNHKSQGGQFKVVIAIIDGSAKYQLNSNLLYTGLSRTREYLLVLGQADAVNFAIGKFANMSRRSFLKDLVIKYNNNLNITNEV